MNLILLLCLLILPFFVNMAPENVFYPPFQFNSNLERPFYLGPPYLPSSPSFIQNPGEKALTLPSFLGQNQNRLKTPVEILADPLQKINNIVAYIGEKAAQPIKSVHTMTGNMLQKIEPAVYEARNPWNIYKVVPPSGGFNYDQTLHPTFRL